MTTTSWDPHADAPLDPARDPVVSDEMAARLQARLEAFERAPSAFAPRGGERGEPSPRPEPHTHIPAEHGPSDTVEDLDQQLEVLRAQLEDAFNEMDVKIAAAEKRAATAEARVAGVAAALDEFAQQLPGLFDGRRPEQLKHLRSVLSRLQARLRTG